VIELSSGEPLHTPIMACELGRLYNKLAVVQHIMNARSKAEGDNLASAFEFSHIKNLKDVVECKVKQEVLLIAPCLAGLKQHVLCAEKGPDG
jgi:hypothetical protein